MSDKEKWKCPSCGEGKYLQGIEPFHYERLKNGKFLMVSDKVWCMNCQKAFYTREVVQFT